MSSTNKLSNVFDRLPPFYIIQNFLGNVLIERLLSYALIKQAEFIPTKIGYREGRLDPEIRISRRTTDFGELRMELDSRFQAIMSQAVTALKLSPFDLAHCEIELVAHGDGAFYKRHIDTSVDAPTDKTQRVLTGVFYFHKLPQRFSGGQLRLHAFTRPEMNGSFLDIEPVCDNLVLFPAWAPHEVLPITCPSGAFEHSRFAINCWYRRPNPQPVAIND